MAALTYFSTPGKGEYARDNFHFSEAVIVGDRLELAGQTGADPHDRNSIPASLTDEISQAFANVNNALCYVLNGGEPNASSAPTNTSSVPSASAGRGKIENGWSKVFRVRTYHVNLREAEKETLEHMVKEVRKWCPDHKPIWTLVEVKGLSDERLRIEVEVEAWLG